MHMQRNRSYTSLNCTVVEIACNALCLTSTTMLTATFAKALCKTRVMQDVWLLEGEFTLALSQT